MRVITLVIAIGLFFASISARADVAEGLPSDVLKTKTPATAKAPAKKAAAGKIQSVDIAELNLLKKLDATYQEKNADMKVSKTIKIPLLEQERKAEGSLLISKGRLRMELNGSEKTLLIVNKKHLWAVTYPPAEFKDAAIQVVKADTSTKKGRAQSFVTLFSQGGFLKFFTATAAQKDKNGDVLFFLAPKQEVTDFKRAQVLVSGDGKKLLALNYWDDRDNETRLEFTDVKFEKKIDEKLFNYTPPANADVLAI
jgi:outer membrane lipoprotein-sorting protein